MCVCVGFRWEVGLGSVGGRFGICVGGVLVLGF